VRGYRLLLFLALLAGGLSRVAAQGGPPMITDDPGTPGDGHCEINLAWTDQRTPGCTEFNLPLLDANYGIGDRLQLNYQAPWVVLRNSGDDPSAGIGDSQLAVKWRFYDAGDQGWQMSTYPRITFLTPGSHSDRRGLADSETTYLLPFEIMKDLGPLSVDMDFGRTFSSHADDEGWMGGVCVGRDLRKGVDLDAEVHATTANSSDRAEITANIGSRIDLSGHSTLLLSVGRDLRNTLGPRNSLVSYCGIQIRL
jgi:hypothetical protein